MKKIGLILLFLIFPLFSARGVAAADPALRFVPNVGTYKVGDIFKVTLGADSGTSKSQAVDAFGTFDAAKLELVSIEVAPNPAFSNTMGTPIIDNVNGKFSVTFTATTTNAYEMTPINGDLAIFTLKAKAVGTANVNFLCTPGTSTDSNIWNDATTPIDLIVCTSNQNGVYTIADGGTVVNPTVAPTATTTTTELPKTGAIENTLWLLALGSVAVLSSWALRFL